MAASSATRVTAATDTVVYDFVPSTSYPAGGELLTAAMFKCQAIFAVFPVPGGEDGTRLFTYDPTVQRLRIFTAIGTEAATSSDQSAKRVRLLVLCWGATISSN